MTMQIHPPVAATHATTLLAPIRYTSAAGLKVAQIIVALWQAALFYFVAFSAAIKQTIFYNHLQRTYLQKASRQTPASYTESLYLRQLHAKAIQSKNPFKTLEEIDKAETKLQELLALTKEHLRALGNNPSLEQADELYQACMNELDRLLNLPITDFQKALYKGLFTTLFRQLDDRISAQYETPFHRYCGCHISTQRTLPDLKKKILKESYKFAVEPPGPIERKEPFSVALMSQSLGGGHNVVQRAMCQRLAKRGGHAYNIEADQEVLEKYYEFKKWTGKSITEWSQFLLQGNYFMTISFLGWISGKKEESSTLEAKVDLFALSLLARGEQDFAVMCFTRHAKAAEMAANRLGMGLLDIATDLDYEVFGFEGGSENPHYKYAMMARDAEGEKKLSKVLKPRQIVEGGFPVREPFLKKHDTETARQEYQRKCGLEGDARVVVLLCGGEGVQNDFAEVLATEYPHQMGAPKMHLFAVCGKNEKKKAALEALFESKPECFRGTALGWTEDTELAKLFAMASSGGLVISAKAGGGTVSEAIATGVPFLACDVSKAIRHENANIEFLKKRQLGETFSNSRELPQRVAQVLTSSQHRERIEIDSENRSMQIVGELVDECRSDAELQGRRAAAFRNPFSLNHELESIWIGR